MTEPIKQEIINNIFENGDKLITGPVLQTVLIDMIDDVNVKDQEILSKTGSWDDAATQIPNLATKEEVTNLSESIARDLENVDLTGYATEAWVQDQGYLKEHQDISNLATKAELTEAENNLQGNITSLSESVARDLENVDVDLTGYATETWVQNQGYLTEHQDISGLATKTEVTNLSESVARDLANVSVPEGVATEAWVQSQDYASKSYVNEAVSSSSVDLTGYATEQWVQNQGYLTEHQDISNLATKGELNEAKGIIQDDMIALSGSVAKTIDDYTAGLITEIRNQDYASKTYVNEAVAGINLSDYATKSELTSVSESVQTDISNLATKTELNDTKNNLQGNITSLSESVARDLTGYATETWVENQGYLKEHQDISGLATKVEVTSLSESVARDLANVDVDLTGYATETWVENQGYLKEHQDISGLATKTELNSVSESIQTDITNLSESVANSAVWKKGTGTDSVVQVIANGTNLPTASGERAIAVGYETIASGSYSHAEGYNAKALGLASHTEGYQTEASGVGSHAEGRVTKATGHYSHAEGDQTNASGAGSHAEGYATTALSSNSHAEGYATNTLGNWSHAEGQNTIASGSYSHAEGYFTKALGDSSHAEGRYTTASGYYSHAEGHGTSTPGTSSHAEGAYTVTSGSFSHAEGAYTTASGDYSHAEGDHTNASGYISHAEGAGTTASGQYSHAEGQNTNASGFGSHTEGAGTTASGQYSHAEGDNTVASGSNSHAEGSHTIASNDFEHAQGRYNHNSTNQIFSVGAGERIVANEGTETETVTETRRNAISILAVPNSETQINTASVFVQNVGGYDGTNPTPGTNDLATVINGLSSGGGSSETLWKKGEGQNSLVQILSGDLESEISSATGAGAVAIGTGNVASGLGSHAEGSLTTSSGDWSHAEGDSTEASEQFSHAEGVGTNASGQASHAEGAGTIASNPAEHAQGMFNHSSENQIFSIGVGEGDPYDPATAIRSNAIAVLNNGRLTGSLFVQNVGGYDGTNPEPGTNDLATVINNLSPGGGSSSGGSSETLWKKGTGKNSIVQKIADETDLPTASGERAVAVGWSTKAEGPNSHAEGIGADASGDSSHAEGQGTKASNNYSHAEGSLTEASGIVSHAEGQTTIASGIASHAEGCFTTASGYYSHAEGSGSKALGKVSHAEGYKTSASGSYSHAEGYSCESTGEASHAEGNYATASANYSHAEGDGTTASGQSSHAEGQSTLSSGQGSHAEGFWTIASNDYEHTQGRFNHNSENQIFSVGAGENAKGTTTRRNAVSILAVPNSDTEILTSSFFVQNVGGYDGTNPLPGTNDLATVISGVSSIWKKGTGTDSVVKILTGNNEANTPSATGAGAVAIGAATTSSGDWSHAEGYKTEASGIGSHAEGTHTNASGFTSHAEGSLTNASGQYSHAEGSQTTASGAYSHAEGFNTIAVQDFEHAQGRYNHSSENQIFSIGTGTGNGDRRNAVSVLAVRNNDSYTGSVFVQNVGGYDGTNPTPGTNDLATVINNLPSGGSSETLWKKGTGTDSIVQKVTDTTFTQPEASGIGAVAIGDSTRASGQASHAEGYHTVASGAFSHAEGRENTAGEIHSHAEGFNTIASNPYEHAQGIRNYNSTNQIFSVGAGDYTGDYVEASDRRRNAISVLAVPNSDTQVVTASFFVQNIGGYDGTNPTPGTNDLATVINGMAIEGGIGTSSETWTFTLEDGSTVTKNIVMR